MAERNDGKDKTDPKGSAKAGAADQVPQGLAEGDVEALKEVQSVLDEEQGQGFRGTEVDMTPNENYTVAGVTQGLPVPEAQANKRTAQAEATNPLVQHPLSAH
jgi:hypothetical protein